MPIDPNRVEAIFTEAVTKSNGQDRADYLEQACGNDSALRARIEALLASHDTAGSFLSPSEDFDSYGAPLGVAGFAAVRTTSLIASITEQPGAMIDRYKLLQFIGAGGFGSVFMAEQQSPVIRKVALKIIRLGMDTKQVISQFESERQALALMEHPHIARVLDAGATSTGRPYFVMELVSGDPITDYCNERKLTIDQRLEVFGQVCRAVQHAHQKGVTHRDIKPTNVLVSTQDGQPQVKVIDFGIAKATEVHPIARTRDSEHRTLIGTPQYMSPEQVEGGPDIDTRTDVYALGVLLYELLTDSTPFDGVRLGSAAYNDIRRILREEKPPTPSRRLKSAGDTILRIAACRSSKPRVLARLMRGDLDWIVGKALARDRGRRYESADSLGEDVRRYRVREPVSAAPPNRFYRLRTLMRKHRVLFGAGSTVAAVLLLGLGAALWQARVASRERDAARIAEAMRSQEAERADRAAGEAKRQAKQADDRRREAQQIADFQSSQFSGIDVAGMGMRMRRDLIAEARAAMQDSKLASDEVERRIAGFDGYLANLNLTNVALRQLEHDVFERALKTVEVQFVDESLIQAQLFQTLADTLLLLGLRQIATAPQTQALATRRRLLGDEHQATLTSMSSMAVLLLAQGKPVDAEPYCRESLETCRRTLGDEHPLTLTAIHNMGLLLKAQGNLPEAERYCRDVLEKSRHVLGNESTGTLHAIGSMGQLLEARGKLDEAEIYYRELLEMAGRVAGHDHPDTLIAIDQMGKLLQGQGKFREAEPYLREALTRKRHALGDEHPETLTSLNNLSQLLIAQGNMVEAEPLLREGLEKSRRVRGNDHPDTLIMINNLAGFLAGLGKLDDAELFYREALDKSRRALGDDHKDTILSIGNLGAFLTQRGRIVDAEPYVREALERSRRALEEDDPIRVLAIGNMGMLLQAQGRRDESEPYYRDVLDKRRRRLGDDHPDTIGSLNNMGFLLQAQGKFTEAEQFYRETLSRCRRVMGNEHPNTLGSISNLAVVLRAQGKLAEAEPYYREALAGFTKTIGPSRRQTADCEAGLGILLGDLARYDEAERHLLRAETISRTAPDMLPATRTGFVEALARLYDKWNVAVPDKGYGAKAAEWREKLPSNRPTVIRSGAH